MDLEEIQVFGASNRVPRWCTVLLLGKLQQKRIRSEVYCDFCSPATMLRGLDFQL